MRALDDVLDLGIAMLLIGADQFPGRGVVRLKGHVRLLQELPLLQQTVLNLSMQVARTSSPGRFHQLLVEKISTS